MTLCIYIHIHTVLKILIIVILVYVRLGWMDGGDFRQRLIPFRFRFGNYFLLLNDDRLST